MQKQAIFQSKLLPYALVAPQLAIVLIFFYWPAVQAVIQSFLLQDAFGLSTSFVSVRELSRAVQGAGLFRGDRPNLRVLVRDRGLLAVLRAAARGHG
ncbi:ABC-type sugar transport system permease subunit [Bradyrhizobium elkanii]